MRRPLEAAPTRSIGPYRHAHRMAVGGMAEVFRALWPQRAGSDRAVVIKRLRAELAEDPERRAMFEHEIALGARIAHPNVVAVLDHGLDEGVPYLVLEYVFGVDLWRLGRHLASRRERLPLDVALRVAIELLQGLEAVHGATDEAGAPLGVVHHDVSPSNVFLSVHGDVKLGDLGIARAAGPRGGERGARAKGKLGYLPPEQVLGREVDQRGDVFSAAVVTAELLLGRPLFTGASEIGVLLAIRDGDLTPFRALAPELPAGLADAVLAGLARDPKDRTATAAALRDALARVDAPASVDAAATLGRRVVEALDAEEEAGHRGALAETIEKDAAWFERETPAAPPALELAGVELTEVERLEVTREGEVVARMDRGALIGAISTGEVRATDRVAAPGATPTQVSAIEELARHLPASTRTPSARRRTQLAQTNELHDLSRRSALSVLAEALALRIDGLLLFERGSVRKEVYLEAGAPSFVTSNQPNELLGESLVAKGVIARAELDLALAVMPRFEGRLGETLVGLGLVDPVQVFLEITGQVREKLLALFAWTDGHAALYRGVDRPDRGFPLAADPWGLLEEGAARRLASGLDRLRDDRASALERTSLALPLPPRLEALVASCEGPRALAELERLGEDRDAERARVLVLLEAGILRWRSPEQAS